MFLFCVFLQTGENKNSKMKGLTDMCHHLKDTLISEAIADKSWAFRWSRKVEVWIFVVFVE